MNRCSMASFTIDRRPEYAHRLAEAVKRGEVCPLELRRRAQAGERVLGRFSPLWQGPADADAANEPAAARDPDGYMLGGRA